jgi:hypothetical protein
MYSYSYVRNARNTDGQVTVVQTVTAIILVIMEFFITFGYPLVFYKLHVELEK